MWWAQERPHGGAARVASISLTDTIGKHHTQRKKGKRPFFPQFLAAVLAVTKGLSRLGVGEFHQLSSPRGFTNVAHDALVPKDIGILMGELEPYRGLLEEPCYTLQLSAGPTADWW